MLPQRLTVINTKLWTNASVRRFARLIVDKSDHKRKELLDSLDTESRLKVVEELALLRARNKGDEK